MTAIIGVDYDDSDAADTYRAVTLHVGVSTPNPQEYRFEGNGSPALDFGKALEKIRELGIPRELVLCSSSVDNFEVDGGHWGSYRGGDLSAEAAGLDAALEDALRSGRLHVETKDGVTVISERDE